MDWRRTSGLADKFVASKECAVYTWEVGNPYIKIVYDRYGVDMTPSVIVLDSVEKIAYYFSIDFIEKYHIKPPDRELPYFGFKK